MFSSFYREWSKRQVRLPGTLQAMNFAAGLVSLGDVAFVDLRASQIASRGLVDFGSGVVHAL
jgi:hypothetical protein